jgi:vacuolar-type H+-ATPase subunit D/Vma8
MEREQEAELQRQRQIVERKRAALQSQIFVVTATYRRTQAELNALIVEVRHHLLCFFLALYDFGNKTLFVGAR